MDEATEKLLNQKFDPGAYDDKPRNLEIEHRSILQSFVEPMFERVASMPQADRLTLVAACLNVSPINCGWDVYGVAGLLHNVAVHDAMIAEVESLSAASPTPAARDGVRGGV